MMMSSVGLASDHQLSLWMTVLLLVFSVLFGLVAASTATSPKQFNVDDYGANGSDKVDDSEAFLKAWNDLCSTEDSMLIVPVNKTYYLKPISFSGPCKSKLGLQIYGTIKASPHPWDYKKGEKHWLMFKSLTDFVVEGGGKINGNGRKWWKRKRDCKVLKTTALTFYKCSNLRVDGVKIKNAQQMHLRLEKCTNVTAQNLHIHAHSNSTNTDGIHVTDCANVLINRTIIGTGDDCISIVSGSTNVKATNISCGPGHGISIGSLGQNNSAASVSNISVNGAYISNTTNGVRIKTWEGGSGYAKNIVFENIVMRNVSNPIIIDQNYCDPEEELCHGRVKNEPISSAVQVSNIVFKNIKGTSATEVAITLNCSKSHPCMEIHMINIDFRFTHGTAKCSEANVLHLHKNHVIPRIDRVLSRE
ncbi:hypothetical protein SAY87_015518 [Trapa incisa]|uniref:Polygalacturonase n=1 Tax=Trapa incisa TaxID=236973 RepID=A0AAN7H3U0_9MYRT|nr:hypothetical protein SAY87_015518 [Trapa incisa]